MKDSEFPFSEEGKRNSAELPCCYSLMLCQVRNFIFHAESETL